MKKILFVASMALIGAIAFGQAKTTTTTKPVKTGLDSLKKSANTKAAATTTKATTTAAAAPDKYHDNVDDRMKGPKGEKVYIGPNGGRYYLTASGTKVYVPYAGNKKPVAKP